MSKNKEAVLDKRRMYSPLTPLNKTEQKKPTVLKAGEKYKTPILTQ